MQAGLSNSVDFSGNVNDKGISSFPASHIDHSVLGAEVGREPLDQHFSHPFRRQILLNRLRLVPALQIVDQGAVWP